MPLATMNMSASVQSCYDARGQGERPPSWRLGEAALPTPPVSLRTKTYPAAFDKIPHRVADAGRVRLGAYAPVLGPPRGAA